jgi:hypothetical protein
VHLLALDGFILFMQMLLTTITYEIASLPQTPGEDTTDILFPIPTPPSTPLPASAIPRGLHAYPPTPHTEDQPVASTSRSRLVRPTTPVTASDDVLSTTKPAEGDEPEPEYVLDLRWSTVMARLRARVVPPTDRSGGSGRDGMILPLPNTALASRWGYAMMQRRRANAGGGTGGGRRLGGQSQNLSLGSTGREDGNGPLSSRSVPGGGDVLPEEDEE